MRSWLRRLLGLFLLAVLVPATGLVLYLVTPYQGGSPRALPSGGASLGPTDTSNLSPNLSDKIFGNEKIIEVRKNESSREIAKVLSENAIIGNPDRFVLAGRLIRQWKRVKAGEYKFSPAMSPLEIFEILGSGISVVHPITVREGENMYEIADQMETRGLLSRERFLSLCRNPKLIVSLNLFQAPLPPSLEGYLFPDTYFFNKSMSGADMVKQMVKHFFDHWGTEQDKRAQALKLTRHELVTLASIIEKETGASEERPVISSVFHNRLKQHMKLQSDPTTIYGMWERYQGKIHKKDLSEKNHYNTYVIDSLPIGPIGNPGKESIQAALYPAETTYFYFVSHNDGTHQFSRSIEEHNRAVQKFQLDPKMREGKSWRDHLRKTSVDRK